MSKVKSKYIDFGTGAGQVNDGSIPSNYTPTNYTPTSSDIKGHLTGLDSALATAGGGSTIFGTYASPRSITASGGITAVLGHMSTTAMSQVIFVQGSGGAVDITASPQIQAHTTVGARIVIIGRSNTNTLKLDDGTGLGINGTAILGLTQSLEFIWDGNVWCEINRNF